jgi:diguanylate cyclase (GGDEF)-like protein/PAS domain S-box-containing protein
VGDEGIEPQGLTEANINALLLQGAGVGTWAWNVQSGELRINEAWAAIIGYTLDELAPISIDTWLAHCHPEDLAESNRRLKQHFDGLAAHYECEARLRHKEGHWVRVLDRGEVLIRDAEGKPLWMFGSHFDITDRWRVETERAELLERFERLAAHLPGYLYQFRLRPDGSSHFPYATDRISYIYGCSPADVLDDAAPVYRVLHPDDAPRVIASIEASARTLSVWHDRYRVDHPERGLIWIEGNATPERLSDGGTMWHGCLRDVTEDELRRQRLVLSDKIVSATQEGVMITDAAARILDVNPAFCRITGYSRDEVIGKRTSILKSGRQDADFYRQMWRTIARDGRWQGEIWNRRKSGDVYAELLSIDTVPGVQGDIEYYVAVFSDINQVKQHQFELDRATYYDALTGMPNRRLFDDRLQVALEQARRRKELVAVCCLDLDRLKQVNEQHGHEVGDSVLISVARGLRSSLHPQDTIARVGGDEFVLLLTELRHRDEALDIVEQVLDVVRQPLVSGHGELAVSASIGVAMFPELDLSPDELLRCAYQAMYRAKQRGRDRIEIFEAAEESEGRRRDRLLDEAREALEMGDFRLFFQPKVLLATGKVFSAEALIRWLRPDGSLRAPGAFLVALTGSPLESAIGDWVIDDAIANLRRWIDAGLGIAVSVNVSVDHLLGDGFTAHLADCLARHRIVDPGRVTLEILETPRIASFTQVRSRLDECRALGVRFSLDDFGTGYSSLTYMRQLPVDVLKIDRSFVAGMLDNDADLSIVTGIIGLGHAFGRLVIAEGAETEAHLQRLRELGCDIAQGYGLSRPMPADQVEDWVRTWDASRWSG